MRRRCSVAKKPESRLVGKIQDALKGRGCWVVKTHGSLMQVSGLPDLLACYRGQFLGLEVKLPETQEDTSPRQEFVMSQIQTAGGIVAVVTSLEQALQVLGILDDAFSPIEQRP